MRTVNSVSRNRIKRVLVVYKRAAIKSLPRKFRQGRHALTSRSRLAEREHRHTLALVKTILKQAGVSFQMQSRLTLGAIRKFDLIITVGGDGTLLKTSHRILDQPVLGINSSPSTSIGALCGIRGNEVIQKLPKILSGISRVIQLSRLEICVNGKRLPVLALNDVLFANNSPGATSRYLIRVGRKPEAQKSSGVWIATAAGSTAGISAAGGKKLPLLSEKIQYLVREPFKPLRHSGYRSIGGVLAEKAGIRFVSKMSRASIFIDGMQDVLPVRFGDRIRVRSAQEPLDLVVPKR